MDDSSPAPSPPTRVRDIVGGIVAIVGLLTLLGIVGIAVFRLPGAEKGPNIVAICSSAFGVIGPIVGAYFGIRSASNAIEQVQQSR
jgi:hypothetical protein